MQSYLSLAAYKAITTVPGSLVDTCAAKGKDVQRWLEIKSAHIRARLVKRYAVDFTDPGPTPDQIIAWLVVLVDIEVWKCIGGNPEGREDAWADKDRERVEAELKEAADAEQGLFELPLRNTDVKGESAVTQGGPYGYTPPTAWGYFDDQAARRDEENRW